MEQSSELANQQERLVDKKFIAGVIVSEGCFGLDCHKNAALKGLKLGYMIRPKFTLQMHDKVTMDLICEEWVRLGLPLWLGKVPAGVRLQVGGCKRLRRVLDVFLPLLTGEKRTVAMVVKAYIDSRLSKSRKAHYSREEMELVNEVRRLNSPNSRYGKRTIDTSTGFLRDLTPRTPTAGDGEWVKIKSTP